MKIKFPIKTYIFLLLILISSNSFAQSVQLLPNIDTANISSTEIPTAEELKKAGANEQQIKEAEELRQRKLSAEQSKSSVVKSTSKDLSSEVKTQAVVSKLTGNVQGKSIAPNLYGLDYFYNANNQLTSSQSAKAPENYIIGVGDEFAISVYGFSYYNGVLKVDNNGAINPPNMGPVYIKGLSYEKAKKVIKAKLLQYFSSSNTIDISLNYSRIIKVNIVGEVLNPGVYELPAINSVFSAISYAGGVNPLYGSLRKIHVKRNGKIIKTLDLYEFLQNPNSKIDYFLEDNDFIVVEQRNRVVEIVGQVPRAMMYELKENENLNALLKYSGGVGPTSDIFRIQIETYENNKDLKVYDVNLDSLIKVKIDYKLNYGDKVIIRRININARNVVEIVGSVNRPGRYQLGKNETINDLINKSGKIREEAYKNTAYISRLTKDSTRVFIPINLQAILDNPKSLDNITLNEYDIIRIFSNNEFVNYSKVFIAGSVKRPTSIDYYNGITLKELLLQSGGFDIGANILRIEVSRVSYFSNNYVEGDRSRVIIEKLTVNSKNYIEDPNLNYVLQPYDQVFVRQIEDFGLQRNVNISGEVKYPGEYTLINKNEKLSDLIKRSGGLTKYSFPEGATLTRKNLDGEKIVMRLDIAMKKYNSVYNYILKEDDEIFIPEVIDFIGIRGSSIEFLSISNQTQVNAPYLKGKRAKYYINEFGNGFKKTSWRKKTYVIQNNSKIDRTKNFIIFKVYPKVKKGSVIYVVEKPKKEKVKEEDKIKFDLNKVIENTMVKLTGVITLFILLNQLAK